ncbi:hypothetical protein ABK040_011672 [Willaertia magna]
MKFITILPCLSVVILLLLSSFAISNSITVDIRKDYGNNIEDIHSSINSYQYSSVKIASFNVQVFGTSKLSKEQVVYYLIEIVSLYDLIFIQEIRDSSQTVLSEFVKQINNKKNLKLEYQISERLGRTSSKEQYGYIYNPLKIKFIKTLQYNDVNDWFERPPFLFVFEITNLQKTNNLFAILGCHVKPTDAVNEISHLTNVIDFYKNESFYNTTILAGDFNAGCSYVTTNNWNSISLYTDKRFSWLISNDADTTVATSRCPYDRFVVFKEFLDFKLNTNFIEISNISTLNFDSYFGLNQTFASDISDHYPIELTLQFVNETNNNPVKSSYASSMRTLWKVISGCGLIALLFIIL